MSQKKSAFGARPAPAKVIDPVAADAFVAAGIEQPVAEPPPPPPVEPAPKKDAKVELKRLTIDVDADLHLKLKTLALRERTTIADLARKQFVKMTKNIE
jgi:hypothetical protein